MPVTVYVSATLRTFVGKKPHLEIEGTNAREVLANIQGKFPDTKGTLFAEDGTLRPFASLFVNETRVLEQSDWERPLNESDTVLLLPVIAGGSPGESIIPEERRKEVSMDNDEIERFNRHLMLKEIGVKGQKRLKASRVLVAGLGALGSPVVQYLAAAGVGTIGIADSRAVELGDLQSQPIHSNRDVQRPRVASCRDTIKAMNPKTRIESHSEEINPDNAMDIVKEYDIVVDCSDNYRQRYLLNDVCVILGKPLVFGAVYQFEGQATVFDAKTGPCFRCQFPSPPPAGLVPTCASGGVASPLAGIIGSIQANETVKLIVGGAETLTGKLLVVDTWNVRGTILRIQKDIHCPVCGGHPTIMEPERFDYDDFCGLKQNESEIPVEEMDAEELVRRIESNEPIKIVDVREPHERAVHRFPNAVAIPIGQLARRQSEFSPEIDTVFICREGKRSILAVNTMRASGYKGPMFNLKGGTEAAKGIIFSNEGGWL